WDQAHDEVNCDVGAHAQQSNLRHAVTYRRDQYVERHYRRGHIAKLRDKIDDCVQAETPAQNGQAKLVVHYLTQDFQFALDLHRLRPQHRTIADGQFPIAELISAIKCVISSEIGVYHSCPSFW